VTTASASAAFFLGAAASLAASWVLVSRIERAGSRFGLSEALLGLVSALAADAPEITSAVTALVARQGAVGAGVVIGSNVFNLAALIGLGAVVAGRIALLRRAVALQGVVAAWVALSCLLLVLGVLPPVAALVVAGAVLVPYVAMSAVSHTQWWHATHESRIRRWLERAIAEEEVELGDALRAPRASAVDGLVGAFSLAVVVVASVAMEHAAVRLGDTLHASRIVVGGVALAAVTSLPNAVAAIYWARRGRGAATLSTALNSNALNVLAGLFVPVTIVGLGPRTSGEVLMGASYAGLTLVVLAIAYRHRGVGRAAGWMILVCYVAFVLALALQA
jgi:cation:H+ antiporter